MLKSSRWKGLQTGRNDIYFRLNPHARNEEPTTKKKRNKVYISRHTRIRLWYEFLKLRIAVEHATTRDRHRNNQLRNK
ncbi:hypothetical protein B0T13DRAFT_489126 [Neurospora crassa]|nr:hypothetical protein B0T13DRAFT_489126 [Neurospora crassa]